MNVLFFFTGLLGAFGLIFTWPIQLLWVILLVVGWGILVIDL